VSVYTGEYRIAQTGERSPPKFTAQRHSTRPPRARVDKNHRNSDRRAHGSPTWPHQRNIPPKEKRPEYSTDPIANQTQNKQKLLRHRTSPAAARSSSADIAAPIQLPPFAFAGPFLTHPRSGYALATAGGVRVWPRDVVARRVTGGPLFLDKQGDDTGRDSSYACWPVWGFMGSGCDN
jgi:hypothetical protein